MEMKLESMVMHGDISISQRMLKMNRKPPLAKGELSDSTSQPLEGTNLAIP
jgi:hypothetical protein